MAKQRGTSNVPMIMGIMGALMQLPGAICAGACAVGLDTASGSGSKSASEAGDMFMMIGLISAAVGFIFGFFGKKSPIISGLGLLAATVLAGITLVTFNFFSLIAVVLFLLGAIFAFVQKKEEVPA